MNRREALNVLVGGTLYTLAGGSVPKLRSQSLLDSSPSWIELNGHAAGWAKLQGGDIMVSRQNLDRGPHGINEPPPAQLRSVGDLALLFSSGMSAEFYRWIGTCLVRSQPAPATGEAVHDSRDGRVLQRRWTNAFVTHLQIPEIDTSRNDPVGITAGIHIGEMVDQIGDHGKGLPTPVIWRRSEFRFQIAGLESLSHQVAGVRAMEFKRKLATNILDAEHRNTTRAEVPEYPVLQLLVQESHRQRFAETIKRHGDVNAHLEMTGADGRAWLRFNFRRLRLETNSISDQDSPLRFRFEGARLTAL